MTSNPLAAAVRAFVRRECLVQPSDRIAIAISGGADSVALGRLLIEIAPGEGAALAGLVHVNHGLRGADSDADERFCRDLARAWGLPIHVVTVDVAAAARRSRRSVEATGRDLRYAAFESSCRELGATSIATGHTIDDQAETVLLRLLRGAGTQGLAGIRARRGSVIRPLLDTFRADLRGYLTVCGQAFREDASNDDRSIPRNRVRHELVPLLQKFSPRVVSALGRTARLAAWDDQFLDAAAAGAGERLRLSGGSADIQVDAGGLARLPPALATRVVRRLAVSLVIPAWSAAHVDAVLALSAGGDAGSLNLPGAFVVRKGQVLSIERVVPGVGAPPFDRVLEVPGRVAIPEAGVVIVATPGRISAPGSVSVVVAGSTAAGPLAVRNRRPGDRFRPLGAPGSRKLQDVLVDRKVPRALRDRVPIVVDGAGRILWVVGVSVAEACRVTVGVGGVVTLESMPLVGDR